MKIIREVLWIFIAFVIALIIQFPIINSIDYKFLELNTIIIFIAIYYIRFIIDFKNTIQKTNKWFRLLLFSMNFFIFITVFFKIQHHLVLFDNFTIISYAKSSIFLSQEDESQLLHYIKKEFLFTGVVCLVSVFILNIKILRSFWVKRLISEY